MREQGGKGHFILEGAWSPHGARHWPLGKVKLQWGRTQQCKAHCSGLHWVAPKIALEIVGDKAATYASDVKLTQASLLGCEFRALNSGLRLTEKKCRALLPNGPPL